MNPLTITVIDRESAILYLLALVGSPFEYHLDDDPHTSINLVKGGERSFTDEQAAILERNTTATEGFLGVDLMWEIYGMAAVLRGETPCPPEYLV